MCFDSRQINRYLVDFLDGTRSFHNRWKRSHQDLILREDLITLAAVRDIQSIETLIELLRSRVGSPVSASSLARDLDFVIYNEKQPTSLVDVKWNEAKSIASLRRFFPNEAIRRTLVAGALKRAKSWPSGERAVPSIKYLAEIDFQAAM